MRKKSIILAGFMLLLSLMLVAKGSESLLTFDVSPNPMEDACEIIIEFSNETAISLVIVNEKDEVIKTVYSGPVHKHGRFKWDRVDALGNWSPAGTYQVVINYQSRYTSTKKTLILK